MPILPRSFGWDCPVICSDPHTASKGTDTSQEESFYLQTQTAVMLITCAAPQDTVSKGVIVYNVTPRSRSKQFTIYCHKQVPEGLKDTRQTACI